MAIEGGKMKLVKANTPEVRDGVTTMQDYAQRLKYNSRIENEAKKAYEITKTLIAKWLKENRGIDVSALKAGETVLIQENGQDLIRITIGEQNRVILEELAKYPDIEAAVRKDMPTRTFKALV